MASGCLHFTATISNAAIKCRLRYFFGIRGKHMMHICINICMSSSDIVVSYYSTLLKFFRDLHIAFHNININFSFLQPVQHLITLIFLTPAILTSVRQ